MWDLIYLTAVMGPGFYLLLRKVFGKEISREALAITLGWTYLMLFYQFTGRLKLEGDHAETCKLLEGYLTNEFPEEMETPADVEAFDACYRYTEEYAQEVADFEANEAANR